MYDSQCVRAREPRMGTCFSAQPPGLAIARDLPISEINNLFTSNDHLYFAPQSDAIEEAQMELALHMSLTDSLVEV